MNTPMIPNRLAEPPPVAPKSFDLDLFDGDRLVGWIGPDRIGFVGFGNEIEAAHAAHVAYREVARRIAQREGSRPVPVELEPLAIRREGAESVVLASGQRIARIVPPASDRRAGDAFGFELIVAAPLDELSIRANAHAAYRVLRKSGVRWSMFRRPAPPARVVADAPVAAAPVSPSVVEDMHIAAPIPRRYVVATVAAFLMVVVGVFAPRALAAAFAGLSLSALLVMRLTVLHARWPRRDRASAARGVCLTTGDPPAARGDGVSPAVDFQPGHVSEGRRVLGGADGGHLR